MSLTWGCVGVEYKMSYAFVLVCSIQHKRFTLQVWENVGSFILVRHFPRLTPLLMLHDHTYESSEGVNISRNAIAFARVLHKIEMGY